MRRSSLSCLFVAMIYLALLEVGAAAQESSQLDFGTKAIVAHVDVTGDRLSVATIENLATKATLKPVRMCLR